MDLNRKCACHPTAIIRAGLEGHDLEPCEIHDPEGYARHVAAKRVDEERAVHLAEGERLRTTLDTMRANDEQQAADHQAETDAQQRRAALTVINNTDPLLARLIDVTGAPIPDMTPSDPGSQLSPGAHPSAFPALAGWTPTSDHTPFDAA